MCYDRLYAEPNKRGHCSKVSHFEAFTATQSSPGLIIVSRTLAIGQAAAWLHLLWAASEADEYVNALYSLP